MTLSVVCLTREPNARLAAVLALLRPAAEEIIVAVDCASSRGLAALQGVVDRLVGVEFEPPLERYLAWLHSLCDGEWILRIDPDEVPSADLVNELPRLTACRNVLQYRIPRRRLYPTLDRWLDVQPWSPDYQIRLVRNDSATLRFQGISGTSAEPALPASYLEQPLYDLRLILPRPEQSAAAAPSEHESAAAMPVPPADSALIEHVLSWSASGGGVASVPVAEPRDVERLWAPRFLDSAAYRAEVVPLSPRLRLSPGEECRTPVRIVNHGTEIWPWGDFEPRIRLAYRTTGGVEGPRTLLPRDVAPGETTVVPLRVAAPFPGERHVLEVDLVHEGVRWFGQGARLEVEVRADDERPPGGVVPTGVVVCITGMHRSGTSLVARVAHLLGVDFGPESALIPAAPDNETGFWENEAVVRLNDEVLAALGGHALAPPQVPDGWEARPELDPFVRRAEELVGGTFRRVGAVGWKDPRAALTLPLWRRAVPNLATVLCIRDPVEVARSLKTRQGVDDEMSARLWLAYVVAAYRAASGPLIVRYDAFFEDYEAATRRIAAFLRLPPPTRAQLREIGNFVQWRLRHHRAEGYRASGVLALARCLYRALATGDTAEAAPLVEMLRESALATRADD